MNTKILIFQEHGDERGALVAAELGKELPFPVRRVYYMYGVGEGVRRGYHAHKELNQVLIAVHGSCKILLDDGEKQEIVCLDSPTKGLFIGTDVWHEMYDYSKDAVLLSLASDVYDEGDYIRDYEKFLRYLKEKKR